MQPSFGCQTAWGDYALLRILFFLRIRIFFLSMILYNNRGIYLEALSSRVSRRVTVAILVQDRATDEIDRCWSFRFSHNC